MKLTEVQFQPWHTVIDNFRICPNCSWVYTDHRTKIGIPCKNCRQPIPRQMLYNWLNATILVNAIQDFYFLRFAKTPPDADGITDHIYTNKTDTRIVIPILFCTLWEVLTARLHLEIIRAKATDDTLQKKLLSDYRRATKAKREKLFLGLTGEKWGDALAELTKSSELNYTDHFEFYLNINHKRNAFIHEGFHWHFKDDELEKIPEELRSVFHLFAQLHNRYVPKCIRERKTVVVA